MVPVFACTCHVSRIPASHSLLATAAPSRYTFSRHPTDHRHVHIWPLLAAAPPHSYRHTGAGWVWVLVLVQSLPAACRLVQVYGQCSGFSVTAPAFLAVSPLPIAAPRRNVHTPTVTRVWHPFFLSSAPTRARAAAPRNPPGIPPPVSAASPGCRLPPYGLAQGFMVQVSSHMVQVIRSHGHLPPPSPAVLPLCAAAAPGASLHTSRRLHPGFAPPPGQHHF